jgi:hypothetical protein
MSGAIDTDARRKKLLDRYGEELKSKYPEWVNLQISLVAGAGFEPAHTNHFYLHWGYGLLKEHALAGEVCSKLFRILVFVLA